MAEQTREMTTLERRRALALGKCRFTPGTFAKRFAFQTAVRAGPQGTGTITEAGAAKLEELCWTYRRHLPADLVPVNNPAARSAAAARPRRVSGKDLARQEKYAKLQRGEGW